MADAQRPLLVTGVGLWIVGLLVAFSPSVGEPFWSPKAALLLLILPATALAVLALRSPHRLAAAAALGFATWAVVSAVASDNRTISVFGLYLWGTGAIFVVALVAAWALGTAVSGWRDHIETALLVGLFVNAGVAWLIVAFDLDWLRLERADLRPPGLAGNPIQLAGLLSGSAALVAPRWSRRPVAWAVPAALMASAVALTGSRAGLGLFLLVSTVVCARLGPRRGIPLGLVLVAGLFVGELGGRISGQVTVASRLEQTAAGGSFVPRVGHWSQSRYPIAERPLLGAGPGNFRSALSPHRTASIARTEGPDTYFADAHNLVVEYAVTTGLPGVGLLLVWVILAARAGTGPLRLWAVAIFVNSLVQPQSVASTPLAFLALGASSRVPLPLRLSRPLIAWTVASGGAAALAAGCLLLGDRHLNKADVDYDLAAVPRADRLLPDWSAAATFAARIHAFRSISEGAPERDAYRAWSLEAVRRDPKSAFLWNGLAGSEEYDASKSEGPRREAARRAAIAHYRQALQLDPWSARAIRGLLRVRAVTGEDEAALRRKLAEIGQKPAQPPDPLSDAQRPGP